MDLSMILGLKSKLETLKNNHPKFFAFLNAVKAKGVKEGSIFEIKVTTPEGEVMETAIKVTASDVQTVEELIQMAGKR